MKIRLRMTDELRNYLQERIDRNTKTTQGGCLEWTGGLIRGYGAVSTPYSHKPKSYPAHRLVWAFANGDIKKGQVVRHTCDNPRCCNLDHLVLGSQADNIEDRQRRGRQAKGETLHTAKLTEEDVLQICKMEGTLQSIADVYGINNSTVHRIRTKELWRHL